MGLKMLTLHESYPKKKDTNSIYLNAVATNWDSPYTRSSTRTGDSTLMGLPKWQQNHSFSVTKDLVNIIYSRLVLLKRELSTWTLMVSFLGGVHIDLWDINGYSQGNTISPGHIILLATDSTLSPHCTWTNQTRLKLDISNPIPHDFLSI